MENWYGGRGGGWAFRPPPILNRVNSLENFITILNDLEKQNSFGFTFALIVLFERSWFVSRKGLRRRIKIFKMGRDKNIKNFIKQLEEG